MEKVSNHYFKVLRNDLPDYCKRRLLLRIILKLVIKIINLFNYFRFIFLVKYILKMEKKNDSLNRDQILSHFQEVTDLYEVEQSQVILESNNWNLDQAIQSFFGGESMITDTNPLMSPKIIKNNDLITNTEKKSTTFKLNELITNGKSNHRLNE